VLRVGPPHPEGLAEPLDFVDTARDLEPGEIGQVVSTTALDPLGLSRPPPPVLDRTRPDLGQPRSR
jgi:hypothetical protein